VGNGVNRSSRPVVCPRLSLPSIIYSTYLLEMSSLQHLFHTHEPPDLITTLPRTNPSLSQSRTRAPRGSTGELFDAIPDSTLHVRHDVAILANLEQLLNESWTDEARSNPVGESWDVFFEMVKDVAAHYTIRNEVNDLGGVFAHQLFTPVNLVASRGQNKLRPQAYPHNDMRSAFSPSVSHLKAGADHYATLSAPPESLVRSENRIAVEKKLPTSVTTRGMMGGVIQAATEQGFRIRKGRDDDGNDQYCSIDTVETSFIDALTQVRLPPPPSPPGFYPGRRRADRFQTSRPSSIWTRACANSAC